MKARTTRTLLRLGLIFLATSVGSAEETRSARPATLEDAARVLDLSTSPLPPGAEASKDRRAARLDYEVASKVADAFEFQKKALTSRGWSELPGGYSSEQAASGVFGKDGYRVSVSAYPSAKAGRVSVMVTNHGNVDTKSLPTPPDATLLYAAPVSTAHVTKGPKEATAAECRKKLMALGWQPYGNAGDTQFFKQNAVRIGVRVFSAPAQGNKTVIEYVSELLSADLPAPADTVRTSYADTTKEVSFDTKASPESVVEFYRDVLGKEGWKPSTERLVKTRHADLLFFLNQSKDLLSLRMYMVDDILRVSLRHQSAAELAELDRLARAEEEARQKAKAMVKPKPPKPTVAITLPAGARGVEVSDDRIGFHVVAGKARGVVQTLQDELKKAGWTVDVSALEAQAGAVSLKKGKGHLTLDYVDVGLEPGKINISAFGVTIEKPRAK
jgi:hypothetical protein